MPITGGAFTGVGVDPFVGYATNAGPRTIVVTASEPLADSAALRNVASYTLTPAGGSVARAIVSAAPYVGDARAVVLLVDGDLTPGPSSYTIQLDATITDVSGNGITAPDSAILNVTSGGTVDHVALALARVITQYRTRPDLVRLIAILAARCNDLEVLITAIRQFRSLASTFGVRLDWIGELYDLPRGGMADTEYRRLLQARARAVSSVGTVEDVLEVLRAAMGGPGDESVTQHYPASFGAHVAGVSYDFGYQLARVVQVARARGVHSVLYHSAPAAALFGFATSVPPPGCTIVGWAATPPGTPDTSGEWAHAH